MDGKAPWLRQIQKAGQIPDGLQIQAAVQTVFRLALSHAGSPSPVVHSMGIRERQIRHQDR